jgi:hypothetical protein
MGLDWIVMTLVLNEQMAAVSIGSNTNHGSGNITNYIRVNPPKSYNSVVPNGQILQKERLIQGKHCLLTGDWLTKAQACAKSVVFICAHDTKANTDSSASGFFVQGNVIVTNNHVIQTEKDASSSTICFDYDYALHPFPSVFTNHPTYKLDPGAFFWTSPTLDVTIVSLGANQNAPEFKLPAPLKLCSEVEATQYLNIIGHPNGLEKRFSFRGFEKKYEYPMHWSIVL